METPETMAARLLEAAAKAVVETRVAVEVGANNIKREARNNVLRSAPTHNAHAAYAIDYSEPRLDKQFSGPVVMSEIGYDKEKPGGPIGNLLEFGGGGDHSPPHRDLGRAADTESAEFEQAISTIARKLL